MRKQRLDRLLYERGLATSIDAGRRLIMAGEVLVDGQITDKPGMVIPTSATVELKERLPYVSRGGLKLEAALNAFGLDVKGLVAADIGASTGGFTDCLLQRGAVRIYAIDVGYGQLAWSLRQDPRVMILDRVNVRDLQSLPEPIDIVAIDVSFISLQLVLLPIKRLLRSDGHVVALIKPQFEASAHQVEPGGVVRDPAVHRQVLHGILEWAEANGWHVRGLIPSPIRGPAGNVEFLAHLRLQHSMQNRAIGELVNEALQQAAK